MSEPQQDDESMSVQARFEAMIRERSRNKPIDVGPLHVLRTIMYPLFYLDDLEGFTGIDDRVINRLRGLYSLERIQRFRMALDWAMTCRDFDFASLLPDLPYDNDQILSYLRTFHETLERQAEIHGWDDISWAPDPDNPHVPI